MKIGIDASNIRAGGGITHLEELLRVAEPQQFGIDQVVVWAGSRTLGQLPQRPWLEPVNHRLLDGPLPARVLWQRVHLERALSDDFKALFVPGGVYGGSFRPFVTMSQNLLPFDRSERKRFWPRPDFFRLRLLERAQASTFLKAQGTIFLTPTARSVVLQQVPIVESQTRIIPHGINRRFLMAPRPQQPIAAYSANKPFRLLYVSIVTMYKHQWNVVKAVGRLRRRGLPVTLDLVGPAYPPALRRLKRAIQEVDPAGQFIKYRGKIPFEALHRLYHEADASIFASTCETFGQILLESMAGGLPIACSRRSSMPDLFGEEGVYFDPEDIDDMEKQFTRLIENVELREQQARLAFDRASMYSWELCAYNTLHYISSIAKSYQLASLR